MNFGRRLKECRMCNSEDLFEFLDLGFLPPADGILKKEDLDIPEVFFPLKVAQCSDCGLTQLTYAVNPERLYNENYSYESSITETGKSHFFDMADSISQKFKFSENSLAIDIGSNVGVLLDGFKKNGFKVLGIDAAPKIVDIANERGIETWRGLIGKDIAERILREKGRAKIISATNVFAHIDDKRGLMESLNTLLDEDGIFVIEAPYLVDLMDKLEYDTIYLDHLEYLSVKPLVKFFEKYGFEVFDVEKYAIHGTSIRVFVSKKGKREISENVKKFLEMENHKGIYDKNKLKEFSEKVKKHRKEFFGLLTNLKKQGKSIVGISAPAKGNTLLNYCKIDKYLIDYLTEKSKIKLGHYTPGMHIPIVSEEKLLEDKPDYGVIFAWNFAKEIIDNNQEFLKNGGKFIIPIPKPIIMESLEMKNKDLFGVEIKKISPVHVDDRGIISDLLNQPLGHVGLITTEDGAVRGNHYHKLSNQYSYILSGKFEVLLASSENPENVKKVILNPGEIMEIPTNVIHTFRAIGKAVMIDMISQSREGDSYEGDVYRVNIEYKQ